MPRRRRTGYGTQCFHVINRSAGRVPLFLRANDYRAFIATLGEGLGRYPVRLVCYCLMPNHWHLIMGPVDPRELSRLMHWVTTTHAVRWHRHRQTTGAGPVYQGRFKVEALDAIDSLMRACRYVERNPLRAGLVVRAQDWPWSSLSERLGAAAILPLAPTPYLSSDAWLAYVNLRTVSDAPDRTPGTEKAETVENTPDPLDLDLDHVAEGPGRRSRGEDRGRVRGRANQDQAHAHVERAEHLGLLDFTGRLKPREQRRHRPALPVK
jgi:putative transposase